jgi:hypothetical protein
MSLCAALAACPGGSGGDPDLVVDALVLDGLVTVPVKDAAPDTTAIDVDQYTGAVAWQTGDGVALAEDAAFAASTVYQAAVTLTAKPGYTFLGVAANGFTYTSAEAVTNPADSGEVTIRFPATADPDPGSKTVDIIFGEDGVLTTGTTANLSIDRSQTQTLTVTAAEGLTDIRWSLNSQDFPAPRGTAQSITLAAVNYPAGTYLLGLAAKQDGVDYSAVITFTVVE